MLLSISIRIHPRLQGSRVFSVILIKYVQWLLEVNDVKSLKKNIEKFRGKTKFKKSEFDDDSPVIQSNDHYEFLVIYKENHIDTFSIDIMSVDKIEKKLDEIRTLNPKSMHEWLNN